MAVTQPTITDLTAYESDALTKWYIDLRNYKSELKRSIDPAIASIEEQMELIEKEFHKRMATVGSSSIKTAHGTASRVQKTKYLVTDSFALREWVRKNPEVGLNLLSATITQSEVKDYLESNPTAQLPDGLAVDQYIDISIRRS